MFKKLTVGMAFTMLLVGCTEEATKEVSDTPKIKEEDKQYIGTTIEGTVMHSSKIDDTKSYVSVDVKDYILTKSPELEKLGLNATLSSQTELNIPNGSLVSIEITEDGVEFKEKEMTKQDKLKPLLSEEGRKATVIFKDPQGDHQSIMQDISSKIFESGEEQLTMISMLFYEENSVLSEFIKLEGDYVIVITDEEDIVKTYNSIEDIK